MREGSKPQTCTCLPWNWHTNKKSVTACSARNTRRVGTAVPERTTEEGNDNMPRYSCCHFLQSCNTKTTAAEDSNGTKSASLQLHSLERKCQAYLETPGDPSGKERVPRLVPSLGSRAACHLKLKFLKAQVLRAAPCSLLRRNNTGFH